jgi:hypothetical protein|tara:strand:+ start:1671 stop:2093 length:423 start_codon:yes stop_codon:yes gene_type:complete
MIGDLLSFKGNQAAAKQAQAVGEFNARLAENEAIILRRAKVREESNLRKASERTIATQKVATAASGIEMSGSPLEALADSYFNTEMDALDIRYAANLQETAKKSQAALSRAEGRAKKQAYQLASYQSLLEGGEKAFNVMS